MKTIEIINVLVAHFGEDNLKISRVVERSPGKTGFTELKYTGKLPNRDFMYDNFRAVFKNFPGANYSTDCYIGDIVVNQNERFITVYNPSMKADAATQNERVYNPNK